MIVAKMHIKCVSNAYIRNRNTFDAELKPFQIRLMFTGKHVEKTMHGWDGPTKSRRTDTGQMWLWNKGSFTYDVNYFGGGESPKVDTLNKMELIPY